MIDCDELIERKVMRKVMDRKKGVKWKKMRKGEKEGCEIFSSCASLSGCIRVRLRPWSAGVSTPSAAIKLLFLTPPVRAHTEESGVEG